MLVLLLEVSLDFGSFLCLVEYQVFLYFCEFLSGRIFLHMEAPQGTLHCRLSFWASEEGLFRSLFDGDLDFLHELFDLLLSLEVSCVLVLPAANLLSRSDLFLLLLWCRKPTRHPRSY